MYYKHAGNATLYQLIVSKHNGQPFTSAVMFRPNPSHPEVTFYVGHVGKRSETWRGYVLLAGLPALQLGASRTIDYHLLRSWPHIAQLYSWRDYRSIADQ